MSSYTFNQVTVSSSRKGVDEMLARYDDIDPVEDREFITKGISILLSNNERILSLDFFYRHDKILTSISNRTTSTADDSIYMLIYHWQSRLNILTRSSVEVEAGISLPLLDFNKDGILNQLVIVRQFDEYHVESVNRDLAIPPVLTSKGELLYSNTRGNRE